MGPGSELVGARKDVPVNAPLSNVPTTFRLATEDVIEREHAEKQHNALSSLESGTDSAYGVRSLQDTTYDAAVETAAKGVNDEERDYIDSRRRPTIKPSRPISDFIPEDVFQHLQKPTKDSSPHPSAHRRSRQHSVSHSLTSISLDSQAPLSSIPSSPKSISNRSLRPLDEDSADDNGSQAVASSSEDDAQPSLEESALQLVMPSIKMPSRRPFTERGRTMGRLKVLVAGDSGVGKTSLIKSMVQTCEDIVYVDPTLPISYDRTMSRTSKTKLDNAAFRSSTEHITEVHASTRPYPSWWADVEETRITRRRKSMGDTVLERNLCFVDTPGYSHGLSKMQGIESTLQYIESQLKRSFPTHPENGADLAGLLSGNGGSQVDLVLYMLSGGLKHEDLVFLQRLSALTNVIPLIARSDTCALEEIEMLRRTINEQLKNANVNTFTPTAEGAGQALYSVCSIPSPDDEVMDASLLMSSGYVQPLFPSELGLLLQHIFEKDTISCLRHLASKKLVHAQHNGLPGPLTNTVSSFSGLPPALQARLTDHMQKEEKLAQVKLAKWASDLQRNLQSERAQYNAAAQSERIGWLTEKLNEQVCEKPDRSITSAAPFPSGKSRRSSSSTLNKGITAGRHPYHSNLLDAGDPLGLLRWNEAVRRRGWVALQIAGSFGILGAVAVWAAKTWGGILGCGCSSGYGDEEGWAWGLFTGRAR